MSRQTFMAIRSRTSQPSISRKALSMHGLTDRPTASTLTPTRFGLCSKLVNIRYQSVRFWLAAQVPWYGDQKRTAARLFTSPRQGGRSRCPGPKPSSFSRAACASCSFRNNITDV